MTQYNISMNDSDWLNDTLIDDNSFGSSVTYVINYHFARSVFIWTLSIIEVPFMILTLFALCFLIKSRHAASVYVAQLILSDLIQIIYQILSTYTLSRMMLWSAYYYSLIVGVYFMACIAFERYLLVAHPIWYRTHHSLKSSCFVSFIIWFVPLIFAEIKPPYLNFGRLPRAIAFFIPYPIIILCFIGTWRGLSHSISLTSHKRKLILGSLFLVLLNYSFLILPYSVLESFLHFSDFQGTGNFSSWDMQLIKIYLFLRCLLYLNPLADCILYLFMRTDAGDVMNSLHCCCRSDPHQIAVRYTTRTNTHSA